MLRNGKLVVGLLATAWGLVMTFKLFELVHATELLWFLFWTSIPMAVVLAVLRAVVDE